MIGIGIDRSCGRFRARLISVTSVVGIVAVLPSTQLPAQEISAQTWTAELELVIGAGPFEEGPAFEALSAPTLLDSLIMVSSLKAAAVEVFDWDGRLVRSLGRSGPGPGEFDSPGGVGVDLRGRYWILDMFGWQYEIFDSDLNHVDTKKRPIRSMPRFQSPLIASESGFIEEVGGARFLAIDTAGLVVDSFPPLDRPSPLRRAGPILPHQTHLQTLYRRYVDRVRWAVSADRTVWAASMGKLELLHRTLAGDTIRIVRTNHRGYGLSDEDEAQIAAGLREGRLDREDLPIVRPVVDALHVTPDGFVLAHIVEEVGVPSDLFDVFSPQGDYLGPLRMGRPINPRSLSSFNGEHAAFMILDGEFEVPKVGVWRIRRGS